MIQLPTITRATMHPTSIGLVAYPVRDTLGWEPGSRACCVHSSHSRLAGAWGTIRLCLLKQQSSCREAESLEVKG